jgi:hypothetical protein
LSNKSSNKASNKYTMLMSSSAGSTGGELRNVSVSPLAAGNDGGPRSLASIPIELSELRLDRGLDAQPVPYTNIGKYCTSVCGILFGGIKLNMFYSPKQSSTYESMTN